MRMPRAVSRRAGRTPARSGAELPRPVQLVAQAPVRIANGSSCPCLRRRSESAVPPGWLQYSSRSIASWTPRVPRLTAMIGSIPTDRHHPGELPRPHLVGLDLLPGGVEPHRPLPHWADAVLPAVARDEVATRVARNRGTHLPDQVGDVPAEAGPVVRRMPRLEDAGVDAPAHVLDECAEDPRVHDAHPKSRIRIGRGPSAVASQQRTSVTDKNPATPISGSSSSSWSRLRAALRTVPGRPGQTRCRDGRRRWWTYRSHLP